MSDDRFRYSFAQPDIPGQTRAPGLTDEYLRIWRLILPGASASGAGNVFTSEVPTGMGAGLLDYAAGLRIHFVVQQATSQTPNTAEITIYNLSDDTANNVIKENNHCVLQAGYALGQCGTIFSGTIKMYKKGHENATDAYLKIYAADGDRAINEAWINQTLGPQSDPKEVKLRRMTDEFAKKGVSTGYVQGDAVVIPPNIRDDVLYGLVADHMRDFSQQNGAVWSVLHQRLRYAKPEAYEPGAIIDLNARTGLIGFPEMTQDGINVTALINSAIRLRSRIKLDNKYINSYFLPGSPTYPGSYDSGGIFGVPTGYSGFQSFAKQSADGIYSPWSITYEGDSRGGPWYMYMVCLTVDSTKDPGSMLAGKVMGVLS